MPRIQAMTDYIKACQQKGMMIESRNRYDLVRSRLFDVIKTFSPSVIVKAGLGTGQLVSDMARNVSCALVVVEPSIQLIRDFMEKDENRDILSKIHLVNGSLTSMPVDYYVCDLLVCVDYLDFIDSSKAIDEFRRVLGFEKHLFVATTVLAEDDLDGVFDDLMHGIFPLHNDYYIPADLSTILELNEFRLFKEKTDTYDENIEDMLNFFKVLYPGQGDPSTFIDQHSQDLVRLYGMKDGVLSPVYYTAVFTRKKPAAEQIGRNPYQGTPL